MSILSRRQLSRLIVIVTGSTLTCCGDDTGSGGSGGGTSATTTSNTTSTTAGTTKSTTTAASTNSTTGAGGDGGAPGTGGGGGDAVGGGGGSGGGDDANIVINEVVPAPVDPDVDWIELYNAGNAPADISNWTFTDSDPTHVFTFPAGTIVQPGAYLTLDTGAGAGQFDFGLGTGGDEVNLYDDSANLVDSTAWVDGDADSPNSWGRFPNGTGAFSTRATVTKGAANQ